MALPSSRNTTYTTASQVKSADLNSVQDCIVGIKRPSAYRWITPSRANVDAGNTYQADGLSYAAAGTFAGMVMPDVMEGDRVTAFAVRHLGTATGWTAVYTLNLNKGDGSPTVLGSLSIVNPAASWATYALTLGTPHVMLPGESLYLSETAGAPVANKLGNAGYASDRL